MADNPFAGLHDQQIWQHQAEVMIPRNENQRWDSGFKLDLSDFHRSMLPEELLD